MSNFDGYLESYYDDLVNVTTKSFVDTSPRRTIKLMGTGGSKKVGRRKFSTGDIVVVSDTNNKHYKENGIVNGYDDYSASYYVKFPLTTLSFRASQLSLFTAGVTGLGYVGNGNLSSAAKVPSGATPKAGDKIALTDRVGFPNCTGTIIEVIDNKSTRIQMDIQPHIDDDWGNDWNGLERTWVFNYLNQEFIILASKPKIDFESVIIEDHKRLQIVEALEQIHQSDLIFKTWGFEKVMEKGRGVPMLFYGLPGTGKTLMAQAIAEKLDCELKITTVADIESSEPGQAERNIRDIFKYAEGKKVVLLFDECDPLIFDRTTLGAILSAQVNELLSCLEKFDGVTIFTTNRVETLDEAVNRRLALKLEFSMPDLKQRIEIWKRMIPDECPLAEDVDFTRLAEVEIAGGYIKNSVLRAARIAAIADLPNEEKKIHMKHLVRALSEEGNSMLEFQTAKEGFNVPRPGSHAQVGTSAGMHRISKMVENLGGAYGDDD